MLAPEIPGLTVGAMTLDDAEDWAAYAVLPESNRFVSTVTNSAADIIPAIKRTLSGEPNAPVLFSVREQGTGLLLATVGFHTVVSHHRTAEVTYTVHPGHWGKGLATAACTAAVRWAFEQMQWVRVQATTLEEHKASQRVLAKCGFQLEGTARNPRIVRGLPRDFLLYSIFPGESKSAA